MTRLQQRSVDPAVNQEDRSVLRKTHILNAASNLLGIALIIVTALDVSGRSSHTFADEIAWLAALCFSASCLLSYFAIRAKSPTTNHELLADRVFLIGLFSLVASVTTLAFIRS